MKFEFIINLVESECKTKNCYSSLSRNKKGHIRDNEMSNI